MKTWDSKEDDKGIWSACQDRKLGHCSQKSTEIQVTTGGPRYEKMVERREGEEQRVHPGALPIVGAPAKD